MRKTLNNALVVLALVGVAACSADVADRTDTLRAVDEDAITSQLLYMQLDRSPFPMTAADLQASGEDVTEAVPVRIEIFDDIAVAWFAPGGVAQVDRDGLMAAWWVENRTPTAGEVDDNAEFGVVTPGDTPIFVVDSAVTTEASTDPTPDENLYALPSNLTAETILDFEDLLTNAEEALAMAAIAGYHPGCL